MFLIDDSKFNMWRGCVAIIFLDKLVSPEERIWVEEKIKKLPLSDEQRNILKKDLETGVDIESILPKITNKVDIAFLVNTFRVLANIDKNFSPAEKTAFNQLEAHVLKGLNLSSISLDADLAEHESYHEGEVYKNYNSSSLFERTFNGLMKSLNPGDYKTPKK